MKKRLISGIQPTNRLTLGNYLGAIKQLVNYQNEYDSYIFIADLHAISTPFDKNKLYENKINLILSYLAAGIDLDKSIIFFQSDIPAHTELSWILTCNTTMGELKRMTQFKDKSAKVNVANGTEFIPTGLFMYPILMASDILLYDADFVVVGQDQKQHVELTRDIAIKMNKKYGIKLFKETEPLIPDHGSRIMDLTDPTIKMSKSNQNEAGTIFLDDKPTSVVKKIMGAKTDSLNKIHFDFIKQPGISNLITIYSCLTSKSITNIENLYNGKSYGDFKKDLADIVSKFLFSFQAKYNQYATEINEIFKALNINANKCNEIANKKLDLVYKTIGMRK